MCPAPPFFHNHGFNASDRLDALPNASNEVMRPTSGNHSMINASVVRPMRPSSNSSSAYIRRICATKTHTREHLHPHGFHTPRATSPTSAAPRAERSCKSKRSRISRSSAPAVTSMQVVRAHRPARRARTSSRSCCRPFDRHVDTALRDRRAGHEIPWEPRHVLSQPRMTGQSTVH